MSLAKCLVQWSHHPYPHRAHRAPQWTRSSSPRWGVRCWSRSRSSRRPRCRSRRAATWDPNSSCSANPVILCSWSTWKLWRKNDHGLSKLVGIQPKKTKVWWRFTQQKWRLKQQKYMCVWLTGEGEKRPNLCNDNSNWIVEMGSIKCKTTWWLSHELRYNARKKCHQQIDTK